MLVVCIILYHEITCLGIKDFWFFVMIDINYNMNENIEYLDDNLTWYFNRFECWYICHQKFQIDYNMGHGGHDKQFS